MGCEIWGPMVSLVRQAYLKEVMSIEKSQIANCNFFGHNQDPSPQLLSLSLWAFLS